MDVVDMFGDKTPKVEADGGGSISVTCYNAVVIGACIKAMTNGDDELICIKPSMVIKVVGAIENNVFKTTKNELVIKTKKGVPFAWVYYKEEELSDYKIDLSARGIESGWTSLSAKRFIK